MPKKYPLSNLPKLNKYPDGMTLPTPKGIDFKPEELLGAFLAAWLKISGVQRTLFSGYF